MVNNVINVKADQDIIELFGVQYLVDKNKLAKDGEYELEAFGDTYIIKSSVAEVAKQPKVTKKQPKQD